MSTSIQSTLLDLCQQVIEDPDHIPIIPLDMWPEGTEQQHLLTGFRDMLERLQQHYQDKLEAQERFSLAVQGANDGLWVQHLQTNQAYFSPRWKSMLGYEEDEISNTVDEWRTRLHPDDIDRVLEFGRANIAGEIDTYEIEYRLRHKDGSYRWVLSRATTLRDASGKAYRLAGSNTDITQRKLAEEQLREKEEQYRSIFEASSDGLYIIDLDGFVVEANPAAHRQLGYTYEELIGMHRNAFLHPDYRSLVPEYLQVIQAGDQFQGRAVDVRKDGTLFPVEVRGKAFTYKGQPHTLSVVRDITRQVEAEQQLREQEEQYRNIFEATDDGLVIQDLDGIFIEANPAFYRMLGYTHEELIGFHYSQATYPEYYHVVEENTKKVQAEGRAQAQGFARRKDGSSLPVEAHSTSFTYKGKPHVLGVMRDITERVEAERQVREREEQYRSVFEATYDALFIIDLDGHIVEINPAFCGMYGYTREEVIGMHAIALTAPGTSHLLTEALETLKIGRNFQRVVGPGLRKDGTVFYAEAQSTPFTYGGRPHALGVVRDVTERVEAEQQLREREAQYRSVFEATYDGLVIFDLDGFIVESNPAYCTLFGYTHDELIGLHGSALFPPDRHSFMARNLESLKASSDFQTRVGRGLRKDGTLFYQESHGTPLTYRGRPYGLGVVRDVTEQVQAQQLLEQRVEERTRELASLLEISHTVASTLQLKPLLSLILDQLQTVVDYTGASILTLEGDSLVYLDHRGPVPEEQQVQLRFPLKRLGLIWENLNAREPILIDDVHKETPLTQALRIALGDLMQTTFHYIYSWMAVPLILRDQVIGMLVLTSKEENAFIQHHAVLALAIANQAAIAIENARLYEQAQELAAVEERQRLARELHDSVSQALYGISLGVHTARLQLDHNPDELAESLNYVLELAEAALTEMRALIFELRPESLETEGLVIALTKQAAALQARQAIAVHTDLCAEPNFPLKIKQELYRIAQEALHNTIKHAHASTIHLSLSQTPEAVILEVLDDGAGFDTGASFPGHLGLHSMRERVTRLGGTFQIESTLGVGTRIIVCIPGVF